MIHLFLKGKSSSATGRCRWSCLRRCDRLLLRECHPGNLDVTVVIFVVRYLDRSLCFPAFSRRGLFRGTKFVNRICIRYKEDTYAARFLLTFLGGGDGSSSSEPGFSSSSSDAATTGFFLRTVLGFSTTFAFDLPLSAFLFAGGSISAYQSISFKIALKRQNIHPHLLLNEDQSIFVPRYPLLLVDLVGNTPSGTTALQVSWIRAP